MKSALRAVSTRLAQCLAGLRHKAVLNRLSIPSRLILLVLGLALPLNLVVAGVVWGLVNRANDARCTSLLYAARSIAAGVDAELGKYIALGEALSRAPALLDERQSVGFLSIDSTVEKGTSVHLNFPKAEPGPVVSSARPATKEVPLGDGELILVVEDADKVREATMSRLESLGYAVLKARTGSEAITMLPGGMTG